MRNKIKIAIIPFLAAILIPFSGVYADDPVIPIASFENLTTYASAAGNYKLTDNITMTANTALREGFVLDLNGFTLDTNAFVLSISGTVTVKDTSAAGTGLVLGKNKQMLQVNANRTLNILSGTVRSTNAYPIYTVAGGTVNIYGGTITSSNLSIINNGNANIIGGKVITTGANKVGIQNSAGGTLTISGGEIEADYAAITNNKGTVTMSAGSVYSKSSFAYYGNTDSEFTFSGGTLKTDSILDAAANLSKPGAKMTMTGGKIVALGNDPENYPSNGGAGVTVFKDTEFTMTGGSIESYSFCVSGNGSYQGESNDGSNAKITITNGTLNSQLTAIYAPQANGLTNISGGTITAKNVAIEIRAGTVNITGGNFIGGSPEEFSSTPNYNGTTAKNAAVVVAQHTTKRPTNVTITGGTFTAEVAFVENNPQGNAAEYIDLVNITIAAGEDGTAPEFNAVGDYTIYSQDKTGFIYAGRYTHDVPDEYIADDHGEIVEQDNKTAVYRYRHVEAEETENGEVEISVERTLRGALVTLNPIPAEGYAVQSITVVDSEGNNIPVANNQYYAPNLDTTVTVIFGIPNPNTFDSVIEYGSILALCAVASVFLVSRVRLARTTAKVL